MLLFHLKKSHLELAKHEIIELAKPKKYSLYNDLFLCNAKDKEATFFSKRLGFCHSIYKFLFFSEKNSFFETLEKYNWLKIYKKDFCVRYHGKKFKETEIADYIYTSLKKGLKKKPIANLNNPKTKIEFFELNNKIIAVLFLEKVEKSYNKRKPHLRPGFHPTSLSPDLARCCINLTGLKKGIIFDPFCGTGGILIEAGLMGFKIIGNDIIKKQIEYAKKNLIYYRIKNFKLLNKDARKIKLKEILNHSSKDFSKDLKLDMQKKFFSITSDLPYGKGSFGKSLENLYYDFLLKAKSLMNKSKNNVVFIFPNFIDYKKIIKKTRWRIKKSFNYYVHKSLTRVIVVLALY